MKVPPCTVEKLKRGMGREDTPATVVLVGYQWHANRGNCVTVQEVREARERNKRQIMAEVRGGTPDGQGAAPGGARGPSPQRAPPARAQTPPNGRAQTPPHGAPSGGAGAGGRGAEDEGDDDNDMDFAAMVKDMQDVLLVRMRARAFTGGHQEAVGGSTERGRCGSRPTAAP